MHTLIQAIGFGIVSATTLVLGAGGFSLQFGLTNVLNFAYGGIMIAAAFIAYAAVQHGLGFFSALLLSAAFGAVLSMAINSLVYRPFARRGASLFGMAIVGFSLATVIQYVVALIFGISYVSLNLSNERVYHLGAMDFTTIQLAFVAFTFVFFVALQLVLRYTKLGAAIRAVAANPLLARACGIPVRTVVDITWLVSGAMCGIGGFLVAVELGSFSFLSGLTIFPVVLAAALVGKVGSASGAFRGALAVGISTEVIAAFTNPALKQVYAFALLGVVMMVRRQGILRGLTEQTVVT